MSALAFLQALPACSPAPGDRLNVLLVTVDTLRADRMSGYGYDRPTTPHIDRLLETAVAFEDAQANSGWTLPALASLMTSLHPTTHGCTKFNARLGDSHLTLAEILQAAGYDTHGVGSHTFLGRAGGLQQGFASFDDELMRDTERGDRHVSSTEITDRGLRWLDDRLGRRGEAPPWLLWLHYFDPHTAYVEHDGLSERFGVGRPGDLYDGEVAFTDRELGRILERLDQSGATPGTLVVFAADHGEALGEHGSSRHSAHLFGEVLHIPLAIRDPRLAPRRVATPVESLDVLPTLLELLGLDGGARMAGRSLVPAMRGERLRSRAIMAETEMWPGYVADSLTLDRWKLIVDRSGGLERLSGDEIRVRGRSAARGEPGQYLFDREADPLETRDVSRREPEIAARLRAELDAMQRAAASHAPGPDHETTRMLSEEEMRALRALGYVEEEPAR